MPYKNSRLLTAALLLTGLHLTAQRPAPRPPAPPGPTYPPALVETGSAVFQSNCGFCHGRDAEGGETGPDLARSKVIADDVDGSAISPIVNGARADKGMPSFRLSAQDMSGIVAFLHTQKTQVDSQNGQRRGVNAEDLQTGDADAGKRYFNGAGNCASCHSPTGDLEGIATRARGLQLEQRMLAPRNPKSKLTVKLSNGQSVTGTLAYRDEFTVALRDADGKYRSWFTKDVTYTVDSPADAHVNLLTKYTDADIHNLMAYLQTLK